MGKEKNQKWKLDPKEVSWGWHGSTSGKKGQFERKLKISSSEITFRHIPTDIIVKGMVPAGNYSKKEMQQNREALKRRLFLELENLVAQKLNIKGR